MESKRVSDAQLTSEGVGLSELICDDPVGIPTSYPVNIEGQILKWKSTKLGMMLLKFQ